MSGLGPPLLSIVLPLAGGVGTAIQFTKGGSNAGGTGTLTKAIPSTSRILGGVRICALDLTATCDFGVTASKGSTSQFTITCQQTTGFIAIRTGQYTGTVIATSTVGVSQGAAHYLEWDVTVGASASYNIYLDGVSILSGTGNTRGDGANNNCDGVGLVSSGAIQSQLLGIYDDFYLFDTNGSTNNAVLLSKPRIETSYTVSDNTVAFTPTIGVLGQSLITNAAASAGGLTAGRIFLRKVIPQVNCTLNSLSTSTTSSSGTAKFKAVIYPDNSGTPAGATLITTGGEVAGVTANVPFTSTFGSPPSLTGGTPYWIGFISDTLISINPADGNLQGVVANNTYASGAPSTCPAITSGASTYLVYGSTSGMATNWSLVNTLPPAGDMSFVQTNTISAEDLYNFGSLSALPSTIYTVGIKCYGRDDDAGARTISLIEKVSGTEGAGNNGTIGPTTSYQWMGTYFDTDPNASAWTGSSVSSSPVGIKILS